MARKDVFTKWINLRSASYFHLHSRNQSLAFSALKAFARAVTSGRLHFWSSQPERSNHFFNFFFHFQTLCCSQLYDVASTFQEWQGHFARIEQEPALNVKQIDRAATIKICCTKIYKHNKDNDKDNYKDKDKDKNYSQHSISAKLIGPQPSKCTAQESINTIKTKTTSSKLITWLLLQ